MHYKDLSWVVARMGVSVLCVMCDLGEGERVSRETLTDSSSKPVAEDR